jgi:hypothetical protein
MRYILNFSNSNNVWYRVKEFYGDEIDMLIFANEFLNNKQNKVYNLWIYDREYNPLYSDYVMCNHFRRGKKIEKLIEMKKNSQVTE